MSPKNLCGVLLSLLVLLFSAATVFAGPVAKVKAFPGGDGLAAFLKNLDPSRVAAGNARSEGDDMVLLILPQNAAAAVTIYGAEMNDSFEIVPNRQELIASAPRGWSLPFWCTVPEGMPNRVVVVTDERGNEHAWSPSFSGIDGSLVTNEAFAPLDAPVARRLRKTEVTGQDVNLRTEANAQGKIIRKASSPEFFIVDGEAINDARRNAWRRVVYSFNEINACVSEVEMYVSARFTVAGGALAPEMRGYIDAYEAAKSSFRADGDWEGMGPDESQEPTIATNAWTDVRVYERPDPYSRVVGLLPKSPENVNDVFISGARVLKSETQGPVGPFGIWWRVEAPIKGWVEGPALGVINSGLLAGD